MTTRLAIILFIIVIAALGIDVFVLGTGISLELARKGAALLQQMAFWR